jgi:hypothetical protein
MFRAAADGETQTMSNTENTQSQNAGRGEDERRGAVNPADNPAPSSPAADEDAVRKGQESLDSVTTK